MPRRAHAAAAVMVCLAVVVGWFLWPSSLGGRATYVVTHGVSMQPRFHTGDLAILHRASTYRVGDVAGYRSPTLDTVVMHRIVAVEGDTYVFKGDNNSWLDVDHPTRAQLLGTLWVRLPHGGRYLRAAHSPWMLAILGVLVATGLATGTSRRRSRRRTSRSRRARGGPRRPWPLAHVGAALLVALLCGAGTAALWMRAATVTSTTHASVVEQGAFSYAGRATRGVTYPEAAVRTGETIFTHLVRSVTVTYTGSVSGPRSAPLPTSIRLQVVVVAPDGWRATVARGTPAPLTRVGTAVAQVTIETGALRAALAQHAAEAGTAGQSATVQVVASAAPARNAAAASPTTAFALDATTMRPGTTTNAHTTLMTVQVTSLRPALIGFAGHHIGVVRARLVAGVLTVLALAAAATLGVLGRTREHDLAAEFLRRHRGKIVAITSLPAAAATASYVDVADAAALARLAELDGRPILHHVTRQQHTFLVHLDGATYRHTVPRHRPVSELRRVA